MSVVLCGHTSADAQPGKRSHSGESTFVTHHLLSFVVFYIVRVFHLKTTLEVSEKEVQHGAMGLDSNPKNQRSANGDAIFQTGSVLGIAGLCLPT